MFYKIKSVMPLDNLLLLVEFQNGQKKKYDIKPLMSKWQPFKDLNNENLFQLVKVDTGRYGVIWNKNKEVACNNIWETGLPFEEIYQ